MCYLHNQGVCIHKINILLKSILSVLTSFFVVCVRNFFSQTRPILECGVVATLHELEDRPPTSETLAIPGENGLSWPWWRQARSKAKTTGGGGGNEQNG